MPIMNLLYQGTTGKDVILDLDASGMALSSGDDTLRGALEAIS
jgi:hypothetical protein